MPGKAKQLSDALKVIITTSQTEPELRRSSIVFNTGCFLNFPDLVFNCNFIGRTTAQTV